MWTRGDAGARGKNGEEVQSEGGCITSRMTCRRENYQGRKRKTG